MYLCFVDESNHGDFYGFVAIMADDHATKSIIDRLNQIVDQAAIDYGIDRTTEIHAHPMFHGRGEWKGVGLRARVSIHQKVIEAVLDEDVTILMRSVNAARLSARQAREHYRVNFPPEQVAFQHILQRADRVAGDNETYALLIADD